MGGTTSCYQPMLLVRSIFGMCYQELRESRPHPQTLFSAGNFLTVQPGSKQGNGTEGSHFHTLLHAGG